jgi:phospholipid transport system substrate-binding protein
VRLLVAASLALLALTGSGLACAQQLTPDALVRRITDEVLAIMRDDKDVRAGNQDKIAAVVQEKILPYFDFRRATQIAVGPGWRQATPEQREALATQFQMLLVRTYSGALVNYRGQTIDVLPVRMQSGDDEVTVRSRVRQGGSAPITIDYGMERASGGWKVFDVTVDGMSLVLNYRTTFSQEIANNGIDGLISRLAAKNHTSESPREPGTNVHKNARLTPSVQNGFGIRYWIRF